MTGGNGVLAGKTLPLAAAFRARKLEVVSAVSELHGPLDAIRKPMTPSVATERLRYYSNWSVASTAPAPPVRHAELLGQFSADSPHVSVGFVVMHPAGWPVIGVGAGATWQDGAPQSAALSYPEIKN